MAAMESSIGGINKEELDDMTTCCICTDVYTDPKALPCIHTFCMKCIQETGFKINKGPGDEMPCPICRRLFKIPTKGFHGLPKNFFIERLIQVAKVSDSCAVSRALCSLCLEESTEQGGIGTPTADTYCVDCKRNLCEECCSEHRKFKATKNHKLMPINEHDGGQNVMDVCEVHEQNNLNVYCSDCKIVVCAICFIEEHNNHKGSHVNKCLDGFRKQIESNSEAMNECTSQAQMKRTELAKVKEEMQRRVESLECDVEKRKDEIKQLTDKDASNLLQRLCSERKSRLKEIQMATDDIDAYLSNLESYNSYCQRITDKGSASDICRAVSDLSVRAFELQQQCQPIIERGIQDVKLCFRQSQVEELLEEDCGNLIGEIKEEGDPKPRESSKESLLAYKSTNNSLQTSNDKFVEELDMYKAKVKTLEINVEQLRKELEATEAGNRAKYVDLEQKLELERTEKTRLKEQTKEYRRLIDELQDKYKSDPVLICKITLKSGKSNLLKALRLAMRRKSSAEEEELCGMTILDKDIFFVSVGSSVVEVYDSMDFSFSRRWNLKELFYPLDIGSCNRNKCLYIVNLKEEDQSGEILRVDSNGKLVKKWSTGDEYGYGLSVTDESNVILTVCEENKLNEYSPDGQLIREINLSAESGIRNPQHAIKLANGNFVVNHGSDDDDQLHRVCVVDTDGKLKKSFGGKPGSTIGQLNDPCYLSVDGNGFVMVTDRLNSRVLLLDSNLEFRREILSKEKHGLRYPSGFILDESNGRLFVADKHSNYDLILIFNYK